MARRRTTPLALLVGTSLLVVAGCGSDGDEGAVPTTSAAPRPSLCDTAVADVVDATQRYVRGYEVGVSTSSAPAVDGTAVTSTTVAGATATMSEAEFQDALAAAEATFSQRCDPAAVRGDLTAGLATVATEGPVADAVLRRVSASMVGEVSTDVEAVTRVEVGDDLRQVLATAPDGATVELAPGEHRLADSLVLLSGVLLRGAGIDATTIVSSSPDAAVVILTDQRVDLRDLAIRREGEAPGSGVLAGATASLRVQGVRVSGGRLDETGEGGAGILLFGDEVAGAATATTLEVTAADVRDNQGAGIVLTGGHRASIVASTFTANGQCGLCFLDAASGSVEDSTFDGNGIGIAATGTAAPTLLRLGITGGEVGVQAVDDAVPTLQAVTVTGALRAALIYGGRAAGSLDGVSCVEVPFGIVVGPESTPQLGETDCDLASSE